MASERVEQMAELLDTYFTERARLEGRPAPQVCIVSHVVVTFVDGDGELTMQTYSDDVLHSWHADIEDWRSREAGRQGRKPSYLEALEATVMEGRD